MSLNPWPKRAAIWDTEWARQYLRALGRIDRGPGGQPFGP